jgi:hypothetical protein
MLAPQELCSSWAGQQTRNYPLSHLFLGRASAQGAVPGLLLLARPTSQLRRSTVVGAATGAITGQQVKSGTGS